jgi:predicted dienelactone hydrolase
MRPVEGLILLAILSSLLAYLVPIGRRPRWLSLLPVLAAVLVVIHLVIEGYRWQMVPAYALATIMLVEMVWGIRPAADSRHQAPSHRRRILALFGVAIGLLVLAIAAALPSVLPVFSLPEPTGPYAVGTQYYYWTDTDRPDEYTTDTGDFREVSVQIWYPAHLSGDENPIRYMHRDAARALSRSWDVPAFLLDHFTLVRAHAYLGADVAQTGRPFPVITYSTSGLMSAHMTLFEELASQGYILVCIGHPYWNPFVYGPGGEVIPFDRQNEKYQAWWLEADSARVEEAKSQVTLAKTTAAQERAFIRLNERMPVAVSDLRTWSEDIGFVLDELEAMNQGDDPLAEVLDLQRVGVMGFSKGGAAAGQFCVTDERCKAGINLTGFMYGDVVDINLEAPFFFISEEELWCPDCYVNDLLYKRADNDAYQMKIRGARHTNFGDPVLYGSLIQSENDEPTIEGERMIYIQNIYSLAFFDKHLKGLASPLLDGPSAEFPEVVFRSNNDLP